MGLNDIKSSNIANYTPSGTSKLAAEKFDTLANTKVTLIHGCKGLKNSG